MTTGGDDVERSEVLTKLPNVGMNTSNAFFPEQGRDKERSRRYDHRSIGLSRTLNELTWWPCGSVGFVRICALSSRCRG